MSGLAPEAGARRIGLTAGEIATCTGGRLVAGDPSQRFGFVAIDSRNVPTGSLFVALPGARVDGHDFIPQAIASGATGVVASRAVPAADSAPGVAVIAVEDSLRALQAMAVEWRRRLRATVVGIAGSNGKTTTKQVLASVLAVRGRTFSTPGNENSQIGAPMAILAAPLDAEFLVLELGTSAAGELGRLAEIARPDVAIVTAAFAEHLEFLGSIAGVIEAETEILDHLAPGTAAWIGSAEPALVTAARRRSGLRVATIGTGAEDDWRLSGVRPTRAGTEFTLARAGVPESRRWRIPLLGAPGAWAAAFAIAAARDLGLGDDEIQRGLDAARPADHRMVPISHPTRPLFVLDDCYNSNPASARAAIEAAVALRAPGDRLVLVLGDMLELGEASEDAHREVVRDTARIAPGSQRIGVGPAMGRALRELGGSDPDVETVPDFAAARDALARRLSGSGGATVLLKGSRGIGLDRLLPDLLAP